MGAVTSQALACGSGHCHCKDGKGLYDDQWGIDNNDDDLQSIKQFASNPSNTKQKPGIVVVHPASAPKDETPPGPLPEDADVDTTVCTEIVHQSTENSSMSLPDVRPFERNISAGVFSSYQAPEPELRSPLPTRHSLYESLASGYTEEPGSPIHVTKSGYLDGALPKKAKTLPRITDALATIPSARMGVVIENPGIIDDCYMFHDSAELQVYHSTGDDDNSSFLVATAKATNARRAVKCLDKHSLYLHFEDAKVEIQIMKACDHPSIIKLYEIFEDQSTVFIVLEHCASNLGQVLARERCLGEASAAVVLRQVLNAIAYLHGLSISHRDIRPSNVVLSRANDLGSIKLADFGWASFLPSCGQLSEEVGDECRRAPEMLDHNYGKSCDVWSSGVILYEMLFGYLPFSGHDEKVRRTISAGKYKVDAKDWVKLSTPCSDVVKRLLQVDQEARGSPKDVLKLKWFEIEQPQESKSAPTIPADKLQTRLLQFHAMNVFKKAAFQIIASSLCQDELAPAIRTFMQIDTDGNGILSRKELVKYMPKLAEQQQGIRMEDMSYTEFLAATFDHEKRLSDTICKLAFDVFDRNQDGNIDRDEIVAGHWFEVTSEQAQQLLNDFDVDHNSTIDFQEFIKLMRTHTLRVTPWED